MGAGFQLPDPQWWMVCLCAQWCGTCRDYRSIFDQVSRQYPAVHFVWLDVEDQEALMDDVDVETFPTLLIARGEKLHFLGPLISHAQVLTRLLDQLHDQPLEPIAAVTGPEAQALWLRIRHAYGG